MIAAEQKARSTYDNLLRLIKDPDVYAPIKFLREREIIHFQRFGEALRLTQEKLDSKNFYAFNPGFDRCSTGGGMSDNMPINSFVPSCSCCDDSSSGCSCGGND